MQQPFGKRVLAGFQNGWREMVWVEERAPRWAPYGRERYDKIPSGPGCFPAFILALHLKKLRSGGENYLIVRTPWSS